MTSFPDGRVGMTEDSLFGMAGMRGPVDSRSVGAGAIDAGGEVGAGIDVGGVDGIALHCGEFRFVFEPKGVGLRFINDVCRRFVIETGGVELNDNAGGGPSRSTALAGGGGVNDGGGGVKASALARRGGVPVKEEAGGGGGGVDKTGGGIGGAVSNDVDLGLNGKMGNSSAADSVRCFAVDGAPTHSPSQLDSMFKDA